MAVDNLLAGTIESGLKKVIKLYPRLGIIVEHRYDPESRPPKLIERQVYYLD